MKMNAVILVALLAGALAGFGVSLLLSPSPVTQSNPAATVQVDLDPLLDELRALRRQLELPVLPGGGRDPSPLSPDGKPALTAADLTTFLDALTDRLSSTLTEPTDASGVLRGGYGKALDRAAIDTLRLSLTDDNEYSPPSVFALTPRQVYARYGTPTTTWMGQEGSIRWVYMSEDEENYTVIHFMHGYVINAWLE